MCANSEGSGETAQMCRLAWAFAGCLCNKYHNLMSWLKLFKFRIITAIFLYVRIVRIITADMKSCSFELSVIHYSSVGTGFLWWTYVDIKNQIEKDEAINLPLLDVEINSERAFLIYSIVSTVLTVSTYQLATSRCRNQQWTSLLIYSIESTVLTVSTYQLATSRCRNQQWTSLLNILHSVYSSYCKYISTYHF